MRSFLRTLCFGIVLAVAGNSVVMAAGAAADPIVGTWQLNVAKSKFVPGPVLKSQTRVYTESAAGLTLKVSTVGADGKTSTQESTFKYDGKDYPFSGSPDWDSLSLTRKDANTVVSTQKKVGKAIGTTVRTLSKDGKVMTLESKGTGANGKPYGSTLVFDRK
jgi:hypothetical protein